MEELQTAMTKLVKLQIKQQERQQRTEELHKKWEEKQELLLDQQYTRWGITVRTPKTIIRASTAYGGIAGTNFKERCAYR